VRRRKVSSLKDDLWKEGLPKLLSIQKKTRLNSCVLKANLLKCEFIIIFCNKNEIRLNIFTAAENDK
jgi:hypothetical protein